MRATRILSGFAHWRWMPCCALVTGALIYVGLIVLVVPKNLGGNLQRTRLVVPASLGPASDALTSTAPGTNRFGAPRAGEPSPLPPRPASGLVHSLSAPVPAPERLEMSRRSALGEPPPAPEPPAPPPPPEPEEQVAPDPPPAPEPPIIHRSLIGGLHMVQPQFTPPAADDGPADDNAPDDNAPGADDNAPGADDNAPGAAGNSGNAPRE